MAADMRSGIEGGRDVLSPPEPVRAVAAARRPLDASPDSGIRAGRREGGSGSFNSNPAPADG